MVLSGPETEAPGTAQTLSISPSTTQEESNRLGEWCPCSQSLPERLQRRLQWQPNARDMHPGKSILLLCCGPDGDVSLQDTLANLHPHLQT